MTVFYICRHGESENNKLRLLAGWADPPLTEKGKQNARQEAHELKDVHIDKIVSSDLERAFATASIIADELNYQDEILQLPDLREVNYGDLANKPYHIYPDLSPEENSSYIPPNGESLSDMHARVLNCIQGLEKRFSRKSVLIVAHDGTINVVRANMTGESPGRADIHNPQDKIFKFDFKDGKVLVFSRL